MIFFEILDTRCRHEHLGMIPTFLDERVPLPAWQQINDNYVGRWNSFKDRWVLDPASMELKYPGDPVLKPLARAKLGDELIYIYQHAWVVILQPNLQWDIARID